MIDLKSAIIILVAIIGCCIALSLGAFLGKKITLPKLSRGAGILALVAVIVYVLYSATWVFMKV